MTPTCPRHGRPGSAPPSRCHHLPLPLPHEHGAGSRRCRTSRARGLPAGRRRWVARRHRPAGRPRRAARPGDPRGAPLPPRPDLAARRVPRRRRLLRRLRLPHHHPAGARAGHRRPHRPARLLVAPRAAAAPRTAGLRAGRRAARPAQRGRPARRHRAAGAGRHHVHLELARDPRRNRLLRGHLTTAADEPVVPRRRGAVLPALATGRAGAARPRPSPGGARRVRPRARPAVRRPDGPAPGHREPHAASTTAPTPTSWA